MKLTEDSKRLIRLYFAKTLLEEPEFRATAREKFGVDVSEENLRKVLEENSSK